MKYLFPITAAAFAFTSMASANAQSNAKHVAIARTPTAIVKSVTAADLRALVLAEGHTIDKMSPFETPSVRGKTKEGLLFTLAGTSCDVKGMPGCQGIMMQVRFDADARVTLDGLNNANMHQAALASWWDKTGKTVGCTRYVVLDDGVTWMNIRQNLRVLLSIQYQVSKEVWPR